MLLEPALQPGIERQAAGRICRIGDDRSLAKQGSVSCQWLKAHGKVRRLCLPAIGAVQCGRLGHAVNSALARLDLSSNALRGGCAIASALATNRTLTHGHLLFNPLDLRSARALASALRESRRHGVPLTLCGTAPDAEGTRFHSIRVPQSHVFV